MKAVGCAIAVTVGLGAYLATRVALAPPQPSRLPGLPPAPAAFAASVEAGAPSGPAPQPRAELRLPQWQPSHVDVDAFGRTALAHPSESNRLRAALQGAFGGIDLVGCLPRSGLVGDTALRFAVRVEASEGTAFFSDARFLQIDDGSDVPEGSIHCIEERFRPRRVDAAAGQPFVRYVGTMEHVVTIRAGEN